MSKAWRLLRYRSVWVTALMVVLAAFFELWSEYRGAQKLTSAELAARAERVHLEFVLDFEPEAFHLTLFQDAGRLIEVDGRRVFMMDLPVAAARTLSRYYWVEDVLPWRGI